MVVITFIVMMVLWRLFGHKSSVWNVVFILIGFFFIQPVNFGTKKKIFIVLMQILVFATIIFGAAYQGVVTSLMIVQKESTQLKTFDELLQSNYKLFLSQSLHSNLMENQKYRKAFAEGRILNPTEKMQNVELNEMANKNTAVMVQCEQAEYLRTSGQIPNFYVINANLFAHFHRLRGTFLSKHLKRWQLLMDWSLEAGLTQAWESFDKNEKIKKDNDSQKGSLSFWDIFYVIPVYCIGVLLGGISLLFEIFLRDFVEPFYKRWKMLRQMRKVQRQRRARRLRRIRRIQVRPIND